MSILTTGNKMHATRLRRVPMASGGPSGAGGPPSFDTFETTWKTDNAGDSTSVQIQLPLIATGTYDFHVDWGDSNSDDITVWDDVATLHTYSSSGTYTVKITGTISGFVFNNLGDPLKLLTVVTWGVLALGNDLGHFYGCTNLTSSAIDRPVVGTTLASTFRDTTLFNGDIDNWDVSSVTDMNRMFLFAKAFNQDLNSWDVSSVTSMLSMFHGAVAFNGNIGSWSPTSVLTMQGMFNGTFPDGHAFNQNIDGWDVSSVTDMNSMFKGDSGHSFNQSLNSWDVSNVTSMNSMFSANPSFNGNITSWVPSSVLTMANMFLSATAFNQDIGSWDVSAVTSMQQVFWGATLFDQDLSSWNTGAVTRTDGMFRDAIAFDQDVGSWDIVDVTNMGNMFLDATLSTTNYDSLLTGWESQAVQNDVNFHGGNSTYSTGLPATARANLIADHTWTITDGGAA